MKKIFGDNIVSKLRSIPAGIWVIFVLISFFFAHAYEFLILGEFYGETISNIYQESGISLNHVTVGVLFSIIEAGFYTLILEIIVSIIYNNVAGRFRCQINRADFRFRIRYVTIIINLIIGVFSIGYFFTQYKDGVIQPDIKFFQGISNIDLNNPYYTIQNSVLPYAVTTAIIMLFYEDFRERYVPIRNQASLFARVGILFVGIYVLLYIVEIFRKFLLIEQPNMVTTPEIIAYSLEGAIYLIVAVIFWLNYRRLKNITENAIKFEIKQTEEKTKDENIYDDFGF